MPIRGHEQITSLDAAASLTPTDGVRSARLNCTGGTVRVRLDAIDPTSSVGEKIADGGSLDIQDQLADVRIIKASGTPVVDVAYFGSREPS